MVETATTLPPAQRAPRFDARSFLTRRGPWVALMVLVLVNLAITPNFATWQTLNVNLTQVCAIVIVGVGMTLVIATGGIDLSVGALMAIAGALAPLIFLGKLFPLPHPAIGIALAFILPVLASRAFASSPSSRRSSCSLRGGASRRSSPTATCRSSTGPSSSSSDSGGSSGFRSRRS